MKRLAILLIPLLLAGCAFSAPREDPPVAAPAITEATQADPTVTEATQPVTETLPPATEASAPETKPPHSTLYIPGLETEDVIVYFNEVCLDAEFSSGDGDPCVVQKWSEPIRYSIHGAPTAEDLETLQGFVIWLNTVEGFPGIQESTPEEANLNIYFCSREELLNLLGDQYYGTDGGVTFWYLDNQIYDAIICCRTDLDQQVRNSVILEEIYNGLGPVQDTVLRPDSIVYSEFSTPQELTEIDQLLLRLLYHPKMECGMNAQACEAVIRELYY